jgi:prepilin-type N-terminal cleavage/methylation domain-containing protein/prepilin-type processing-associated H-X9-DG protein
MKTRFRRRARLRFGFTLIELLVVIAIIVLLAALIFPVFSRARENAKRASCLSQMKQIGIGLLEYAQDYDETLPTMPSTDQGACNTGSAGVPTRCSVAVNSTFLYADPNAYQNWIAEIQPYVKSWQLFKCPSANTDVYTKAKLPGYVPTGNSNNTYMVNGVLLQRKISALQQVSTLIWAQDFAYASNLAIVRPVVNTYSPSMMLPLPATTVMRTWLIPDPTHFNGLNLLYCDGHAKWRDPARIPAKEFGLSSTLVGPSGTSTSTIDSSLVN